MLKALVLAILLTSCSPMSVLDLISPSKGVEVNSEIVVGDKQEENVIEVGAVEQEAGVINNIQETSPWFLLLFALGWILPGPAGIWKGVMQLRSSK